MSRDHHKITEYDLHAYADGALDGPARAAVQAHLAENPAATKDVDGWKRQNETLRALYGHVAADPMPPRLSVYRIERKIRTRASHWGRMAAAAILLIATGAAVGWYGHGMFAPVPPARIGLVDEAMEAHRIYSSEVAHPVEVWAGEKDHLQAWLSKRLARPLNVPDLRADGLALVGGRLLPAQGGPAAQFMYEDDTGHRVTLYIIPAKEGREISFRYAKLDRLEAFFWTDEAISCALVGDLPRARLQEIASRAYKQLG
ncbi:MAG: anti-sigma factor [Hyphomicrobiales bacterium]|nr:anti-sigma factor [Hyphomicrobiales bacterium]